MADISNQLEILKRLFKGRTDVHGLIINGGPKCIYKPITDQLLLQHLQGRKRVGVYPIIPPDTVHFSTIDFDFDPPEIQDNPESRAKVERGAAALIDHGFYPYLERSRSKGFHMWLFFDEGISAGIVRTVLQGILKEVGIDKIEIFPKQDVVTSNNGVGNFIFYPLCGESVPAGRTLFLKGDYEPYPDQWEHLSRVHFTKTENILELSKQYCENLPEPRMMPAQGENNSLGPLDVERYLSHYGVKFQLKPDSGRTFYLLDRCLFADEHTTKDDRGDSSIVQGSDGKLGFQCFHAHCSTRTWADARKTISGSDLIFRFCAGYTEPKATGVQKDLSYLNLNLPSALDISRVEVTVQWLARNLIPKDGLTTLHSLGGIGKTHLMYRFGNCVANGEPFFNIPVVRMTVYYIDFENPLSEISDRMRTIGGSPNMKIWHLGHEPAPIRFDANEWEIYKTFPPGLFIVDSLRSSHLMEENSSRDAAFVMARFKEIRALGNTIILIHHENKLGGYRGSTAWFDLSDHILKVSRVQRVGSDVDAEEENFDLPIRLGLGGKSRFSSAMDLKPLFFKFENHQLCSAVDPNDDILGKMADLLNPSYPPNQSEFQKLAKDNLGLGKGEFRKLLERGESRGMWFAQRCTVGHKLEYRRR